MAGTAVVRATDGVALANGLKKAERTLTDILGSQDMALRTWKVAFILVKRTPDLQKCSVESIVNGMLMSAQLGLELGMEAHLVPFKDEAVFIPDWKGLVRLAINCGALTRGHADLVYANDTYHYRRTGTGVDFVHERKRFGARAANDTVEEHRKAGCEGVYFIGYTDTLPVVGEMSVDDVEYVRRTYSKQVNGPLWAKRWSAGAMKTVTKQALKLVPMSPKLKEAIELDNRIETGMATGATEDDLRARDAEASLSTQAATARRLESLRDRVETVQDRVEGDAQPEPSEVEAAQAKGWEK